MQSDEECRANLGYLCDEFIKHLQVTVSKRTATKQTAIIELFKDFLCFDCRITTIDDVTVGMANSYFSAVGRLRCALHKAKI